jgi:hypothetical protein
MSMAELMRAVAGLPTEQQNEWAAFLLHLRLQHDPAWRTEMTRRIDDTDPAHWTALDDWKKELAASGDKGWTHGQDCC